MKSIFRCIQPKSGTDDTRRVEFIFNVLVVSVIGLLLAASIVSIIVYMSVPDTLDRQADRVTWIVPTIELIVFVSLYTLSRRGLFRLASYIFLGIVFSLATFMAYQWGVDLPYFILVDVLLIVMAGILINTRFAFFTAALVACMIIALKYAEDSHLIQVTNAWKHQHWGQSDNVIVIVILLVITVVTWLSNREIERSLIRARKSEAELKVERDSLEIKVEERTRELKQAQVEKMSQLYHFAEFGKLSSGVFHDLINLLTPVSLNIEQLKKESSASESIDRAIVATKKMEGLVSAVRGQVSRQQSTSTFSVREEIRQMVDILMYKARKAAVDIILPTGVEIQISGDPLKFSQVILNLVTNAIDAYTGSTATHKVVTVSIEENQTGVIVKIADYGAGITIDIQDKIFEAFFTTKPDGIGVGLSMTKHIVENDFGGTIHVASQPDTGTVFTVLFPFNHHNKVTYVNTHNPQSS